MASYDVILAGGGLANCLIGAKLLERPDVRFVIVERGPALGGNHTWSFHERDGVPEDLASARWDAHTLRFPSYERTLGGYRAIRSADLHRKLLPRFGERAKLGHGIRELTAERVVLDDGSVLEGAVIDGRGFLGQGRCGYQKFVGLDVRLSQPHGLTAPILMDATVAQDGGFRFIYVLPWSETELLIEDTCYGDDSPLEHRVFEYAAAKGWQIAEVLREERAALPIPLDDTWPIASPASGVRAGLFHPTTGYSLPYAVRFAEAVAKQPRFSAEWQRAYSARVWKQGGFYRMLNRMLFDAVPPAERVLIFERFYRRPRALVERFYSGQTTAMDKARILMGPVPVPLGKAFRAAINAGARAPQ